ncbi:MAG: hypothetical protein ACLP01_12255 [Solirubrobacteraceae bacterium]
MSIINDTGRLDEGISELREALAEIQDALVELDGDATRKLLAGTALSGETAERWQRADQELQLLWKWFLAVGDLLKDVTEKRGAKSSLPPARLQDLAEELRRPAVEILSDTPLPESARSSRPPVTLRALVAAMNTSILAIEQAVKDAERAWDRLLPRVAELEAAAAGVERSAQDAGVRVPNDLTVARRLIGELRRQCTVDPFAVHGDPVAEIARGLERAQAAVQESVRARSQLGAETAALLAELERALEELERARDRQRESAEKITGAQGALADYDRAADELRTLLGALQDAAARAVSDPDAAARSLASVRQRSVPSLARARALAVNAGVDLATRDELRGRLDAYRAKARAMGRGEDLQLEDLYRQAIGELFSAPCDLARCNTLVLAYQRALSAGAARSGR